MGVFATRRRRPSGVAAEEQEQIACWLPSGDELQPLAISNPPGMHHLVGKSRQAPVAWFEEPPYWRLDVRRLVGRGSWRRGCLRRR
jgi:hypothetical protein